MAATPKLTHKTIGVEVRRGACDASTPRFGPEEASHRRGQNRPPTVVGRGRAHWNVQGRAVAA
jgi:hypothetical protein